MSTFIIIVLLVLCARAFYRQAAGARFGGEIALGAIWNEMPVRLGPKAFQELILPHIHSRRRRGQQLRLWMRRGLLHHIWRRRLLLLLHIGAVLGQVMQRAAALATWLQT